MKRLNIGARLRLASTLTIACASLSLVAGCEGVLNGENADGTRIPGSHGDGDGDGDLSDKDKELGHGVIQYEAGLAPTPLARLTNEEFLASAQALLGIAKDAAPLMEARNTLVAEPLIGGLPNDAKTQLLKQLTVASFSNIASAATNAFVDGVSTPAQLATLLECEDGTSDISACTKAFGAQLVERAYRRPATPEDVQAVEDLVDQLDELLLEKAPDPNNLDAHILRLRTVIRYVLLSPDYLLLVEKGITDTPEDVTTVRPLSSLEIATRMSYFLSGGPPDAALLAEAKADTLTDVEVRLAQADRLLESAGGQAQVEMALLGWLGVKDTLVDTASIEKLSAFIGEWFNEEKPFSDFYQAPISVEHLDGQVTEEPFGVLGQDAFLGSHTSYPTPAFITRGVFLVERLLCLALPADIPAEALEAGAQTDLEVFEVHDQQPCATCHQFFDNFGAGLQQFDAQTGLFVPGPSVLGTGFELRNKEGVLGVIDDVEDLGAVMGSTESGESCMAELWYRSAKRRDMDPSGADEGDVEELVSTWKESGNTSLKSLLRAIVASDQFVTLFP